MCAPAIVPIIASAAAIAGGVYLSEKQKADQSVKSLTPDPEKVKAQAERKAEQARAVTAQRPTRADAAEALYGNPIRTGVSSGGDGGAASTGISTQVNASPTALTLGKSDLLGQ